MTLFLPCLLTNSLNYFKVDEEELPPAGFDDEESPADEFDEVESLSVLQALTHS
jgi:hypothetical protein